MNALALLIISLLSFYGYCFALAKRDLVNPGTAPFIVTSFLLITSYAAAFTPYFGSIVIFLMLIGLVAMTYELSTYIPLNSQTHTNRQYNKPILLQAFFVILIGLILTANDIRIHFWDDFTHWGVVPKLLFNYGHLLTPSSDGAFFPDYPPGAGLFLYFFHTPSLVLANERYYEVISLVGQSVILVSCFGSIFHRLIAKSALTTLLVTAFLATLSFTYINGFATLMIEAAMAFYFAACVYSIFFHKEDNYLLIALPGAIAISLLKAHGLYLGFVILSLVIFNEGYARLQINKVSKKALGLESQRFLKIFILSFITAIIAMTLRALWLDHVNDSQVSLVYDTSISAQDAWSGLFNPDQTKREILNNFLGNLIPNIALSIDFLKHPTNNPFHLIFYIVCAVTIVSVIAQKNHEERKRIAVLTTVLYFGFFMFCLGLLIFYQNAVAPSSAIKLTSFSRFISQYFICLVVIGIGVVIETSQLKKSTSKIMVALIAIPFLINPISAKRIYWFISGSGDNSALSQLRSEYDSSFNKIKQAVDESSRLVVIWQCPTGAEALILSYDLQPLRNRRFPHLGPECEKNINLYVDLKFRQTDTHVLIAKSNQWFVATHGHSFPGLNSDSQFQLYKLDLQNSTHINVTPR